MEATRSLSRRWMRPLVVTLCLSLVLATTTLFAFDRWVRRNDRPIGVASAQAHTGDSAGRPAHLWRLPTFRGRAQDGHAIDPRALRGRTWIADFVYTQCTSACPMLLTPRMMLLARKLFSITTERFTTSAARHV